MRRPALVSAATAFLLAAAACGGPPGREGIGDGPSREQVSADTQASPEPTVERLTVPDEITLEDFDPGNFDRPLRIDNTWMPLVPGTQFVYEGRAIADTGGVVRRRIEFTVTDLTKVIAGVRTRVLWILDFNDDELVEAELAFRAQDDDGTVWHLGEFPQEYERGGFAAAPAWIAGLAGARAGIAMHAEPSVGGAPFSQGFAPPPINWIDHGLVTKMGEETCVPVACYEDVLVTEEFEPDSAGAFQLKYYAPGVGNVRVGWRGLMEEEREKLVLVGYQRLSPEALAEVRAEALALEERAYSVNQTYARTRPAELPSPA